MVMFYDLLVQWSFQYIPLPPDQIQDSKPNDLTSQCNSEVISSTQTDILDREQHKYTLQCSGKSREKSEGDEEEDSEREGDRKN